MYTSDVDDSTNATLELTSESFYSSGLSRGYPTMRIDCRENSTQFYFSVAGAFLSDNQAWGNVGYRVGQKKAQSWNMQVSANNQALGFWRGSGIPQIKKLIGQERLLIWVTPYSESKVQIEFNVTDLGDKLKDVRVNCGW